MSGGHARVNDRRSAPGVGPDPGFDHSPVEVDEALFEEEDYEEPAVGAPPRWAPWTALALCLAGTGVSIYLTIAHFSTASILACASTGTIDCEKVTTSSQSEVFGILPVAVLGLGFFVAMTVLNLPALWRSQDWRLHALRLAGAVVGMGFVLYLLVAELFQIGAICLWCTSVHVVTFCLFLVTVTTVPAMLGWAGGPGRLEPAGR